MIHRMESNATYAPIVTLVTALLDYAANDARVSQQKVQVELQNFKNHYGDLKSSEIWMQERYNDTYVHKRAANQQAYMEFVTAKAEKYKILQKKITKPAITEYLSISYPQGDTVPEIYTRYI